jgi:hypothetical protein
VPSPLPVSARTSVLPPSLPPIGLNRIQAAEYVGVSPSHFDSLIEAGRMPQPHEAGARLIWSVRDLTDAFLALPKRGCTEDVDSIGAKNTCAGKFGRKKR